MSQLKNVSEKEIDFSKGFVWIGIIRINKQKHKGRKVIYQIKQLSTKMSITIGLDTSDALFLWLVDAQGKKHKVGPLHKNLFFEKYVYLICEIIPFDNKNKYKISLGIDDNSPIDKKVFADLGSQANVSYSIGADLSGKSHAAFELGEFLLYSSVLKSEDKENLYTYAKKKWGI